MINDLMLDLYLATYGNTFTLRQVVGNPEREKMVQEMLEKGEIITDEKLGLKTDEPNVLE